MSDDLDDLLADRGGYVLLTEEPNVHRAHLVAGALNASGIPTFVDEDNLVDEWAMSQKLTGVLGVRVLVPGAQLDEARTVFLAMSQPIPVIDEDEELEAYASASRSSLGRMAGIGLLLALGLPALWWLILAVAEALGWSARGG